MSKKKPAFGSLDEVVDAYMPAFKAKRSETQGGPSGVGVHLADRLLRKFEKAVGGKKGKGTGARVE